MTVPADVLVAGGGPAGWATARACARRGLATVLVEPRPDAPWGRTYGSWRPDLPSDLPERLVAAGGPGVAIAVHTHEIDDEYVVLDTDGLQAHLADADVTVVRSSVAGRAENGVVLDDGTVRRAALVVDATGAAQVLSDGRASGPRPAPRPVEQTAVGVVVDPATAARVTGGRLLFMDWRPVHGRPGWPTFLYAVPVGPGRVLLEETSLARRPGLPLAELRLRLHARLRAHGLTDADIPDDPEHTERVRFRVDSPRHRSPAGVVAVGAAAPTVHPASGYSVASSLRHAPRIAEAVAAALDGRVARGAAEVAREVVAPPAARAVHALRHRGLDTLLRMPPAEVPVFFDRFFALPSEHRRAYLSAHDDVARSLAAMWALFGMLPGRMRGHLVAGSVLGAGDGSPSERPPSGRSPSGRSPRALADHAV